MTPREIAALTPTVTPSFTFAASTLTLFPTPGPMIVNAVISPVYTTCASTAWYKIVNAGYDSTDLYLTLNTNVAANSTNHATWTPNLPLSGRYKVEAFVAFHNQITFCGPKTTIGYDTSNARYKVYQNGSLFQTVSVDQKPLNNQWATIGTYRFMAGVDSYVVLTDLNGKSSLTRTVSFNVLRFTYVGP